MNVTSNTNYPDYYAVFVEAFTQNPEHFTYAVYTRDIGALYWLVGFHAHNTGQDFSEMFDLDENGDIRPPDTYSLTLRAQVIRAANADAQADTLRTLLRNTVKETS